MISVPQVFIVDPEELPLGVVGEGESDEFPCPVLTSWTFLQKSKKQIIC